MRKPKHIYADEFLVFVTPKRLADAAFYTLVAKSREWGKKGWVSVAGVQTVSNVCGRPPVRACVCNELVLGYHIFV